MKKIFTDERVVGILRGFEASEKTIKEFCRGKNVSEGTFYKWRSRFGTMDASEVKEHRQLGQENVRLKRLLAERDLEIDVLKEVLAKSGNCRGSPRGRGVHQDSEPVGKARLRFDRTSPEKSSLPATAEIVREVN